MSPASSSAFSRRASALLDSPTLLASAVWLARDIQDFERIHRTELSRLPRVARVQSSFALREIVNRAVPTVVFSEAKR